MKRKVLVPLLLSLLLSGCSANVPEEATTSSSSQKQMTSETVESSQSSLSDTKTVTRASASGSTSESVSETESPKTPETASAYPYQIDMSQQSNVLTVSFEGFNVPDTVTIDQSKEEVTFESSTPDDSVTSRYRATIATVPTKTIRVFSVGTNQIREVKVNTQISIGKILGGTQDRKDYHGTMYLFYNHDGVLSLATPNYAGNVPADQMDVMQEVLP